MKKIKAAIVGSTGYVGQELYRILNSHQDVEVTQITSVSYLNKPYSDIYKNFKNITPLICSTDNLDEIAEEADVVFLALPHGLASKKVNQEILSKCRIIDLSADYRLKCQAVYEDWYKTKHESPELLRHAVYGLCELYREKIKGTYLVANPGCYTTCSILSLYPLVKEKIIDTNTIIIDAKSGVTGAGRSLNQDTLFCECNESIKAYKISDHRHTPEIEQELSFAFDNDIKVQFTPHLTPMSRGILSTCYAKALKDINYEDLKEIYDKYYGNEYFIRIMAENCSPETKWVKGSNFLDIGLFFDKRTGNIIVIGAIDNLVKGAAGQAIQNMNILFDLDETSGLKSVAMFPA